jgi:hypothetical protein
VAGKTGATIRHCSYHSLLAYRAAAHLSVIVELRGAFERMQRQLKAVLRQTP